jgi:hypothetical protein
MTSPALSKPLSMDEFRGLATIARARQEHLITMFSGARIVYGKTAKATAAYKIGSTGKKVYSTASKLTKGAAVAKTASGGLRAKAIELITDAVGIQDIGDLAEVIAGEAVEQLIAEMMPYVGIVVSGYKAAKAWKQLIEETRTRYRWNELTPAVLPGDPFAACEAVKTLLERDIARDSVKVAQQTAAFAAKIAGLAGDFGSGAAGTAIGLANGLASLVVELTQLGIDIREMRAGNKRLEAPGALDASVFGDCPLLGSYMIAFSPTSMVLNFFVADIGLPGWMSRVEDLKKRGLDPLVETATSQISHARITIEGVKTGKGIVESKGIGDKLKSVSVANARFQFKRQVRARLPF